MRCQQSASWSIPAGYCPRCRWRWSSWPLVPVVATDAKRFTRRVPLTVRAVSIHPLLRLVATRPQLLADHVEAYAALVNEEIGQAILVLRRRVVMSAVALGLLAVGGMLCGVALMLWAVTPGSTIRAVWMLVIVPAVPLVVSLLCVLACQRETPRAFSDVKQQLAADFTMLREVGSTEQASP